jgi:predicted ArsR family transcriptional regulator
MQDTRQKILSHLGCASEATVSELAEAVGLAPVTVRHHLNVLRERGHVSVSSERIGRGRPRHVYRLSSSGAGSLCSGGYEALATRMIEQIKETDVSGGARSAERFFEAMAHRIVDEEGQAFREAPVEARLDTLVGLLTQQGFLASWERDGEDFLIRELGCPYATLGIVHAEICCMDRALIEATGCGSVTRERWRLEGDEACVYRVRPGVADANCGCGTKASAQNMEPSQMIEEAGREAAMAGEEPGA